MLSRISSVLVVLICFFASCSNTAKSSGSSSSTVSRTSNVSLSSLESGILTEINRYRQSKGLSPLRSNDVVATEASLHSQHMANRQVAFGHGGYEARVARIDKRLGGISGSGENVAYGATSAKEVVRMWINSPVHRKNIEGKYYNITGIGVSRDSRGMIYYTQLFATK